MPLVHPVLNIEFRSVLTGGCGELFRDLTLIPSRTRRWTERHPHEVGGFGCSTFTWG